MNKTPIIMYTRLTPDDKKLLVNLATKVWKILDGKPVLLCWLALMLNVKRLGEYMLKEAKNEDLKIHLRKYLEQTEEWIITQDKINHEAN